MAEHGYRKMQTPYSGVSDISFSFHSGAAQDDSFPGDGYVDAYGAGDAYYATPANLLSVYTENAAVLPSGGLGSGVFGVIRKGTGLYEILLRREHFLLMNCSLSLETQTAKALFVQLAHPGMETKTGTDGVSRSVLNVRIINTSGADTDLQYQDRVHVSLKLKNTSVP